MINITTDALIDYIRQKGAAYQLTNCLIEADEQDVVRMKDTLASQINNDNWEFLTKSQTHEKGFEELADWAIDSDYIVAIELSEPINDEYYVAVCFPKSDFQETV
ncbi:MAG: hypothetical protein MR678_05365 [Muribaculaceae bacterium]|nr:hypothetical protein [Muribaculaceae bacterium]